MRRWLLLLLLCLGLPASVSAQVTFDTSTGVGGSGTVFSGNSISNATAFTVGSNSNRACVVGIGTWTDIWADTFTVTCAGASGTAISGTQAFTAGGAQARGTKLWGATAPQTGASKTCSASWSTNTTYGVLGCEIVYDVDPTTPFSNGTNGNGASPKALAVTSATNKRTITVSMDDQGGTAPTSDQTRVTTNSGFGMDHAAGASTVTHTWTSAGAQITISGVSVNDHNPTVAVTGTATASITEADVVAGGKTILLTATGDTYVDNLAAISYVGGQDNSFAGTTSNTDVTFSLTGGSDATPAAGDLVVVTFCTGSTVDRTLSITNTGGTAYTLIGSELYSDDTFDTNMRVAYRFMPGTPETAVRFAGGSGNAADAATYAIQVFRNVDTGTPMDVSATTVSAANQNTRLIDPPSITPSTAGAWIGISGCAAGGTLTADFTDPGDVVNFRTDGQTDTNDSGVAAWHYTSWTSGAYDHGALTGGGTDTTSDSYASVAWALRPATDSAFDNQRDELRDGCDSAQAEGTGWDALKTTTMPVANVVRTSSTVVTVTLQAAGTYNITAQETITCTVPAGILEGGGSIVASPTFTVDTSGGGGGAACIPRMSTLGVSSCGLPAAPVRLRRPR